MSDPMDNVWLDLDPMQNKLNMGALKRGDQVLAMLPLRLSPNRSDIKDIVAEHDRNGREAAEYLAQTKCLSPVQRALEISALYARGFFPV